MSNETNVFTAADAFGMTGAALRALTTDPNATENQRAVALAELNRRASRRASASPLSVVAAAVVETERNLTHPTAAAGRLLGSPGPWPSTPSVRDLGMGRAAELDSFDAYVAERGNEHRTDGGFTFSTQAETVSAVAVARLDAARDAFASMGIVRPPTARVYGGVINDVGRDNLSRSHAEWASNPLTVDACADLARRIRAEERRDIVVKRPPLLGADGKWIIPNELPLSTEDTAFDDVVRSHATFRTAGAFMRAIDVDDRRALWNKYAPRDPRYTDPSANAIVLRTRKGDDGNNQIYAVVTEAYTAFDADRVCDTIVSTLRRVRGGSEARGEVTYDPADNSVTIDASWHARGVHDFGAGDVINGGIRWQVRDGGGAIRGWPTAFFNLCFNLIITSRVNGDEIRIVHRGDERTLEQRLVQGTERMAAAFEPFVKLWGYARSTDMVPMLIEKPSADSAANVLAIMRAIARAPVDDDLPLVDESLVPELDWSGVRRDTLVEALLTSHRGMPGNQRTTNSGTSLAEIASAVTRLHVDTRIPVPVLARAEQNANVLLRAFGS